MTMTRSEHAPPVVNHDVPRQRRAWRITAVVSKIIFWLMLLTIALATALVYLLPNLFMNGGSLAVLTGSMSPAINPGDLVVVQRMQPHEICRHVQPGDIVSFRPDSNDTTTMVTHRVRHISTVADGLGDCVLTTQGDANNIADPPIPAAAVTGGKVRYTIPKLGYPISWINANPASRPIAAASVVGVFTVWWGIDKVLDRRARRDGASDYKI